MNHSSSNCPKYVQRTNICPVKNGLYTETDTLSLTLIQTPCPLHWYRHLVHYHQTDTLSFTLIRHLVHYNQTDTLSFTLMQTPRPLHWYRHLVHYTDTDTLSFTLIQTPCPLQSDRHLVLYTDTDTLSITPIQTPCPLHWYRYLVHYTQTPCPLHSDALSLMPRQRQTLSMLRAEWATPPSNYPLPNTPPPPPPPTPVQFLQASCVTELYCCVSVHLGQIICGQDVLLFKHVHQ